MSDPDWLPARRAFAEFQRHGICITGTVLDLGCGASPWRTHFPHAKKYLRMDKYAVDRDVHVIESIYSLPLADSAIDAVILSRMVSDVPDQQRFWRELARILAPHGIIFVYETMTYPQHDMPNDYWRVLPGGLRWVCGTAGLQVSEVIYCGGLFAQIAIDLNGFILAPLDKLPAVRVLGRALRAAINLTCHILDKLLPRPELATDYFACVGIKR